MMKPTCIAYTNTYVYNYHTCAVPCLPTGRHPTIKINYISNEINNSVLRREC